MRAMGAWWKTAGQGADTTQGRMKMPDERAHDCELCGSSQEQAHMLPIMVMDDAHPMGMRAAWFCDKSCLAAWMDAQDALGGTDARY
jgi:hypothetical protein